MAAQNPDKLAAGERVAVVAVGQNFGCSELVVALGMMVLFGCFELARCY